MARYRAVVEVIDYGTDAMTYVNSEVEALLRAANEADPDLNYRLVRLTKDED